MKTKTPDPYEIARLAAALGRHDDEGVEEALRIYVRAQNLIEAFKSFKDDAELRDIFTKGAKVKSLFRIVNEPNIPFEKATKPGLENDNPHFVASERTIQKYIIDDHFLDDGTLLKHRFKAQGIDGVMKHFKRSGFRLDQIERLQELRKIKKTRPRK